MIDVAGLRIALFVRNGLVGHDVLSGVSAHAGFVDETVFFILVETANEVQKVRFAHQTDDLLEADDMQVVDVVLVKNFLNAGELVFRIHGNEFAAHY